MKDTILLNKLWQEVEDGRVTASQVGSLTIFKYTQETHFKDLWNDVNRQARGIIFDTDGTIVARPFSKFFNLHERPETNPDTLPWSEGVEIYEKIDGSCGIGYFGVKGPHEITDVTIKSTPCWRLATPGSMESDQAIEGTRMLYEQIDYGYLDSSGNKTWVFKYNLGALPTDCTPIFEIIYPTNRIVVDYHDARELVLLAIFEKNGVEWHPRRVDAMAEMCSFRRPERYDIDLRNEIPFTENSEGYVCRFASGLRIKVKSPTYVRIHRLLNCLSPKGVIELIRHKQYDVTVKQLPKAIAADFDDVRAYVQGIYHTIITNSFANHLKVFEEIGEDASRKNVAAWIIENVPKMETGFVFALIDGKDIEDKVWKLVLAKVKVQ